MSRRFLHHLPHFFSTHPTAQFEELVASVSILEFALTAVALFGNLPLYTRLLACDHYGFLRLSLRCVHISPSTRREISWTIWLRANNSCLITHLYLLLFGAVLNSCEYELSLGCGSNFAIRNRCTGRRSTWILCATLSPVKLDGSFPPFGQ